MSDWAYKDCPECGKRVHLNHTCSEFNGTICTGDPWDIIKNVEMELLDTEQHRDRHIEMIGRYNIKIQKLIDRLPSDHPKRKTHKSS